MTPAKLTHKQPLPLAAILVLSLTLATSILLIQPVMAVDYYAEILDLSFDPQCLCIEKSDTVNWDNNGSLIHWLWFVFAENGSTYLLSDPIPPGESWSHSFTESQRFKLLYYSFNRLWIEGTIKIWIIFGDVDGNGIVNRYDFGDFGVAYGSSPGDPNWNEWCDFDCTGKVDRYDFGIFGAHYGMSDP